MWKVDKFIQELKEKGIRDEEFLKQVEQAMKILAYYANIGVDLDPLLAEKLWEANKLLKLEHDPDVWE